MFNNAVHQCCSAHPPFSVFPETPVYNQSLAFDPAEVGRGRRLVKLFRRELNNIEAAVQCLQTEKTRMESNLARQVGTRAPIQRVPDELLLLMFKMACGVHLYHPSSEGCFVGNPQRSVAVRAHGAVRVANARIRYQFPMARAPWSTAAVSTRWRALALSCPQL